MEETGSPQWWDGISDKWREAGDDRDRPEEFKALASFIQEGPVFELGCGFGSFVKYLKEGVDYVGADISIEMVKEARNRFPDRTFLHLDFFETTDDSFPLVFEFAVCLQTLEHFTEEQFIEVMDRLKKVAKRGLLFSIPTERKEAHLDHRLEWLTEEAVIDTFSQWGRVELIDLPDKGKHWIGVVWYECGDDS